LHHWNGPLRSAYGETCRFRSPSILSACPTRPPRLPYGVARAHSRADSLADRSPGPLEDAAGSLAGIEGDLLDAGDRRTARKLGGGFQFRAALCPPALSHAPQRAFTRRVLLAAIPHG